MEGEKSEVTADAEAHTRDVTADANPETALAAYGSLRPGEPNHWVVNRIPGTWLPGSVRGWSFELTFGPAEGYEGFVPDPNGGKVAVDVLVSEALAKRWREIDDFEGAGYERRSMDVTLESGEVIEASIYVALTEAD